MRGERLGTAAAAQRCRTAARRADRAEGAAITRDRTSARAGASAGTHESGDAPAVATPDWPVMDELSRTLGGIEKQLELILKTQSEDRAASATYRTEIRREIAGVREDVGEVKGDVKVLAKDVDAMKPVVGDYQKRSNQADGAAKLTKILWGILTALGLGGIVALFESLRRHGP